jgi:hypothetical protein
LKIEGIILGLNATEADRKLFVSHYLPLQLNSEPKIWRVFQPNDSYELRMKEWKDPYSELWDTLVLPPFVSPVILPELMVKDPMDRQNEAEMKKPTSRQEAAEKKH